MNTTTTTTKKFIAYRRVSTTKQGESGLGLEAQQASIEKYVASVGGQIIKWYVDIESGKNDDRPEFQKAIAQVRRTRGAKLIVAKQDRIARKAVTALQLIDEGLFVDLSNPFANRLEMQLRAVIDEEEARRISERTKAALQAAKMRGVQLGTPENLTQEARQSGADKLRQQAVDAYSKAIAEILKQRSQGLSFDSIAQNLNGLGMTTRTGAEFRAMTVRRILEREKSQSAG